MPRHAASSAGPRSSAVSCVGATRMVWCQTWWTSVRLRERVDTLRVPRAACEATRDARASHAKPSGVTRRGHSSAGLYLRPRAFARRGEGDPRMGILRLTVQGSETVSYTHLTLP